VQVGAELCAEEALEAAAQPKRRQGTQTMPRNVAAAIQVKIKVLANDPYSATNVKKLTGRDGYRLRVGDWRVLFEINDGKLVILVLAVRPRGGAYE